MCRMRLKKEVSWLFIIAALVGADQVSKYIVERKFPSLLTFNRGIAFGIFSNVSSNKILILISVLILIYLLYFLFAKNIWLSKAVLILLFSGICANLIDRLYFGHIRDFIDLKYWPSFNLADSYLVLALLIFTWPYLLGRRAKG